MRWLYHVLLRADLAAGGVDVYAPASLAREGFLHASYQAAVAESAALYFPTGADLVVLQIDPRALGGVPVDVVTTPRGPMPHIAGALRRIAIARLLTLDDVTTAPDALDDDDDDADADADA